MDRLDHLKTEYAAVLAQIDAASPEYGQLLTIQPVSPADLQKDLGADTVLLEYFVTPEETILWILDGNGVRGQALPISGDELTALIRAARTDLTRPASKETGRLTRTLERLYAVLIAPAEPALAGKTRVVVVPHGPLHLLPFAALLDAGGRPLVARAAVAMAPSGSATPGV